MSDFVLDASALLALIQAEAGSDRVAEGLGGAVISAINLAEVVTRLADRGVPGQAIRRQLTRLDLGVNRSTRIWPTQLGSCGRPRARLGYRWAIESALRSPGAWEQ